MGTGGVERGTIEMVQAIARVGWVPLVASSGGRFVADLLDAGGDHITLPLDNKEPYAAIFEKMNRMVASVTVK